MYTLNQLPHASSFIFKGDDRLKTYKDNPTYFGNPDALYFARDFKDVADILKECNSKNIPITFAGSRTSLVGASAADEGLVIALEKTNRLLDIGISKQTGKPYAIAEPGILLGEFKGKVWDAGYFYPPDPTSLHEVQLGATVATNATGEDTFYYGPTRAYVRKLKILTTSGKERVLERTKDKVVVPAKNTAGYYLDGEEIDLVIGSEGSLALIIEVTVELVSHQDNFFSLLIPFPTLKESLKFVVQNHSRHLLRALELIGPGAYEIFSSHADAPHFPSGVKSLIYLKQEYHKPADKDVLLSQWFSVLEPLYQSLGVSSWMESIYLGDTPKQKEDIRKWRHHIPSTVNEQSLKLMDHGGGKLSTDWWVPMDRLVEMMLWVYDESQNLGVDFLVFGHIGNGHPHWNFMARNKEEKEKMFRFVTQQCQKVVAFKGGLAGEHGVGKIHHDYLSFQQSPKVIEKMVKIKSTWDPHWILGRGNIF